MKRISLSRFSWLPMVLGAAAMLLVAATIVRAEPETEPAATQPADSDHPATPAHLAQKLTIRELYLKGGWFMYPLTACSILAITLIIERFLALQRSLVVPSRFIPSLRDVAPDLLAQRDIAINYCRTNDSSLARMLGAGIKRLPRGWPAAEKAIEDAGANEALKLRRNMRFLYAIGSVATLLGLIGTISGMIIAFQNAADSTTGNTDIHALSTGMYEAMVNTFSGLAVAIVVTIFYYYFAGRIERLISELNDALAKFSDEFGLNEA